MQLTAGRLLVLASIPQQFGACFIQADVLLDLLSLAASIDMTDSCELNLFYDLTGLLLRACESTYIQV